MRRGEAGLRVSGGRRGLTLLEVVVVVGVVAVVGALSLPALRSARASATDAKTLSNLRSSLQDSAAWSGDRDDVFPNGAWHGGGMTAPFVVLVGLDGATVGFDYWDHAGAWRWVMWSTLGEESEAWGPPGQELSGFVYGLGMVTDPRLWRVCPFEPDVRARFYRFVRWSETAFPSDKGMLLDAPGAGAARAIGFVDGSGRRVRVDALAVSTLDVYCVASQPTQTGLLPVVYTLEGILGRDALR